MKIKIEAFFALLTVAIIVFNFWIGLTLIASEDKDQGQGIAVLRPPTLSSSVKSKNNDVQNSNSTRPYLILHIGPPKTATTFIQCGLHKLSKELADNDSYYYVGKTCPGSKSTMENNETNIPGHFLMMGLNDAGTQNRGYLALKSRMDYHRLNGNNIIYSNEAFANHLMDQNSTWDCLHSMLQGWNVRVIIGYRHYFDWIRSFYYQTNKQNARLDTKWPTQRNGKAHPSFIHFLDYHLQRRDDGDLSVDGGLANNAWGHHLAISAYKKFSPHFDDIGILNLHDTEDMVTDFVCKMLPDADNTCRRLRAAVDNFKDEGDNHFAKRPSQSFDAHRVAEAAFEKGYVTDASPKEVVVEMVKKKIEESGVTSRSEFLACPERSLVARLLSASIEFENEMFTMNHQERSASEKEQAKNVHMSMYRKNEAEGRFCEMNPDLILKDDIWVNMLSKIGEQTAKNSKTDN